MIEEMCSKGAVGGILLGPASNLTLSQNIDRRIRDMQEQIERLERVKELLQKPDGILNVPLHDLRFAMNY